MRTYGIFLLLSIAIVSCGSKKKAAASNNTESVQLLETDYVSIFRAGCYGTCPIYQLKIFGNGDVVYFGRNFVEMVGVHVGKLDIETTEALFVKLNTYSWKKYPDQYPMDNVDFPQFVLEFKKGDFVKTIRGNTNTDEELIELGKYLDTFTGKVSFSKED
jgi:hypothetical protein